MRTLARMETYFLQIAFWVTLVLGGLALVLTVSGLFSVLSYLVEQRTQGDRRADGARRDDAERDAAGAGADRRPVTIGLLAGAGLAVALATLLLSMPKPARRSAKSCTSSIRSPTP